MYFHDQVLHCTFVHENYQVDREKYKFLHCIITTAYNQ